MGAAVAAGLAVVSYVGLPWLLLRFYCSDAVARVTALRRSSLDTGSQWLDDLAVPSLLLVVLQLFFVVALHVLLLFRGLFPTLAGWATGLNGYLRVDGAILVLLVLTWGAVHRRRWAWWGTLVYLSGMFVLWVGALVRTSWSEMLTVLAFPPTEVAFLDGMPLQGWHLAVLVGLPLIGSVVATVASRPGKSHPMGRRKG